jgi:hypothetical protein
MKASHGALDAALHDGRTFVDPSPDELAALRLVEDAGLVRVFEDQVFRCFDPDEDASTHDAFDRSCFTWVPWRVPDGADPEAWEDAGYIVCPRCGREHHPTVDGRTAHPRRTAHIELAGITAWIERAVREVDPDLRRSRVGGVGWELFVDGREVDVVWLDASAGTPLTTRARALSRPTVWVVTRRAPWAQVEADEPWMAVLPLAEWLADPRAIRDAIARTRRDGPLLVSEPALRSWAPPLAATPRVFVDRVGARVLRVGDDAATLDDHVVVSAEATTAMAMLRVLVDAWREDVALAADAHRWLPVAEVLRRVKANGLRGTDDNLGRQLRRLPSSIADRYTAAAGTPLGEDAVIEASRGGWRLSPGVLVLRA